MHRPGLRVVARPARGSVRVAMALPTDMDALERRVRSLAGERIHREPVAVLAEFTDPRTFHTIRTLASSTNRPVEHLFDLPWLEGYQSRVSSQAWRAFAQALLEWAGDAADDGLPLAVDSVEDPPPPTWSGVEAWAAKHGVVDRLEDPSRVVLPLCLEAFARYGAASMTPFPTVRSLLDARVLRPHPALRDAARAYLAYCAGRRARMERRREQWSRDPDSPPVSKAIGRLRALASALCDREPPPPISARGVSLDVDEETLRVVLRFSDWISGSPRTVWVALTEERDGRALASTDGTGGLHASTQSAVRLAAELALDILTDEAHPLHEGLVSTLGRPQWSRLLEGLSRVVTAPAEAPVGSEERIVWRVDYDGRGVHVGPAVQRRNKRGWTRGRAADATALAARSDLDARDRRALDAWAARGASQWSTDEGALLQALVGHPRVVLGKNPKRALRVRRTALEVDVREQAGESWLGFSAGELELSPADVVEGVVPTDTFARLNLPRAELIVASVPPVLGDMAALAARFPTGIPRKADEALLALLGRLPASVGLRVPPRLRGEHVEADAVPRAQLEPLPGGGLRVELKVRPVPDGPVHPPGEGPRHLFAPADAGRRYAERDIDLERQRADEAIAGLRLDRAEPDGRWAWLVDAPEDALELLVAARELEDVVRVEWPEGIRPWEVVGRAGFDRLKAQTKGVDHWLALRGELSFDEASISLVAVMRAVREGRRFVELAPGRFARLEDDLRRKLGAVADVVFEEDAELVMAPEAAGRLRDLLPEAVLPDPGFAAMCERLTEAGRMEPPIPALSATLRPYQEEGVRWLLRTSSWSRGACLADDMGLGKTLQALALLVARSELGPALIVCPTSVADNWRAEAARFAPQLRVRVYRGGDRKKQAGALGPGDVLVTSYDILVRDVAELAETELATLVFDEAQALKNPETRRREAAARLRADFRLALSGTPLENHLGELWSIVDVLVPGLLGPPEHFKARFAAPIERDGDSEALASLRQLLAPFLLRRTKEQVAPELPDRTEVVRVVELSQQEQALYELERRRALETLSRRGRTRASAASRSWPR